VRSYRALVDKDTGRPRGYAFAEFEDADDAASAVRNLNDYELQNRKLRVDYANDKTEVRDGGATSQVTANTGGFASTPTGLPNPQLLPPLPAGVELPPGVSAVTAIDNTLKTLPPGQFLDALQKVVELSVTEPEKAYALFEACPQLGYAIFQGSLLMSLIEPAEMARITQEDMAAGRAAPNAAEALIAAQEAARQGGAYQFGRQAPTATFPSPVPPPQASVPPQFVQYQQPPQIPAPQPYQPPTAAAPAAPPVGGGAGGLPAAFADPNNVGLIRQVLEMSQQQLDAMAPNERAAMMALRAQLVQQLSQR